MRRKIFLIGFAILFCCLHMAKSQVTLSFWSTGGNSLTSSSQFIGTTNSYPLIFQTNNTTRMTLSASSSYLGLGTSPACNLHVNSNNNTNSILMTNLIGNSYTHGFLIKQDHKKVYIRQQENDFMYIKTPGGGLSISDSGKVGFGTDIPQQTIHVVGGNILISRTSSRASGSTNGSMLFGASTNSSNCTHGAWGIEYVNSDNEGYGLNFWRPASSCNTTYGNYFFFLADNGNVGIGTNHPQAKLAVNGEVLAKSVRVNTSSTYWPDYVFSPGYDLMSLKEVEKFVTANQHLPGIPSATEIGETNQMDLGEMNKLLLQKVEELTLYIIDLQKQIDELKK